MVDVIVGAEGRKFHLHRDLLCDRSDFFQAAFRGHFKEAEIKSLTLPEDSIESFELLVGWLYGAPLVSIPSNDEFPAYLGLIILARKLCLEHLQNETMDHVLRYYRTSLPSLAADIIRFVYENTSVGDPLRRLTIRCASWTAVFDGADIADSESRYLLEGGGEIAVDFASTLAEYCFSTKGDLDYVLDIDPRRMPNCFYHKHKSTAFCGRLLNQGDIPRLDGKASASSATSSEDTSSLSWV